MVPLETLIQGVDIAACHGDARVGVTGVTFDSRTVRPGFIFAALPGTTTDGWDHVHEAVSRGAACVLTERKGRTQSGLTVLEVRNVRYVAALIAAAFYQHPTRTLPVIGVTGTNGKTTTAYMIRAALEAHGMPCGLLSTVEYALGDRSIPAVRTTPEAVDLQRMFAEMKREGCAAAVMEVSSHSVIQHRIAGTEFSVGVFTNLSREHLDYHGSMEQYFQAKATFLRNMSEHQHGTLAVVNADNAWGARLVREGGLATTTVSYGEGDGAMLRAIDVECRSDHSTFRVESPWGSATVRLPHPGRFNVSNALAALGVCAGRGIDLEKGAEALAHMSCVPGRLEEVQSEHPFKIFVDYAHTDDALERVLSALREVTEGRLIVVFGCGGDRDRSKRPAMGRVAARLADHSVLTSDNPRSEVPSAIIEEIRDGFEGTRNYEVVEDRREAIRCALALGRKGDVILVAGKGHENFQQIGLKVVAFDDRDVIRELL